jgi:hypothetical protein
VQALAELHDTPDSSLSTGEPSGLGVVWIAQLLPFQASANVTGLGRTPSALPWLPMAVHALAELHDTPDSRLDGAPAGLGVVWTLQLDPFQRSANVTCVPLLLV